MKTRGRGRAKEGESNGTKHEAPTREVRDPALDPETIALLAYYYREARGCPHDSSHEDWLRAAADIRNGLASAATD